MEQKTPLINELVYECIDGFEEILIQFTYGACFGYTNWRV